MVEFSIDVEYLKFSELVTEQLADYLESLDVDILEGTILDFTKSTSEEVAQEFVDNVGSKKALKYIREATKPDTAVFVAVMDDRTTDICSGLNGKEWPIDSSAIAFPPRHHHCRSSISYIRKSL